MNAETGKLNLRAPLFLQQPVTLAQLEIFYAPAQDLAPVISKLQQRLQPDFDELVIAEDTRLSPDYESDQSVSEIAPGSWTLIHSSRQSAIQWRRGYLSVFSSSFEDPFEFCDICATAIQQTRETLRPDHVFGLGLRQSNLVVGSSEKAARQLVRSFAPDITPVAQSDTTESMVRASIPEGSLVLRCASGQQGWLVYPDRQGAPLSSIAPSWARDNKDRILIDIECLWQAGMSSDELVKSMDDESILPWILSAERRSSEVFQRLLSDAGIRRYQLVELSSQSN